MKKFTLEISMSCFLSLLFIGHSFGQAALSDTAYVQATVDHTVAGFHRAIGDQLRLYDGHEYLPYDRHIKGNALYPYDAETWEPGNVTFDGIVYKNVPMMYDIYKDVVVVLLYNKFSMFSLQNSKVHDFGFSNHHFVRVETDSLNSTSGISTGFYDQLYGGNKVEVLAKRVKTIQTSTTTTTAIESYFVSANDYYIRKGSNYYKIGSQSSILSVLKDKRSLIQQYIKDNGIKYRADPETAMAKIASYYDHLTN